MNMWPFRQKKTLAESGLLHGLTDWHCHLLPGVDDGVQTLDESLALLASYEQQGIQSVWLTPHIMEDIPNTTARLKARFEELLAAYQGPLQLHLAAEHMLDGLFEERLREGDLLPIGDDSCSLLVETSYFNPPYGLHAILKRIQSKGYNPVLAHPERYLYMDKKEYEQLHAMRVHFQLNLPSLAGGYGKEVQRKAEWLLKQGYYHYTGTDTHSATAWQTTLARRNFWPTTLP